MVFPFDCIPENSRIVLYGAGNYARFLLKNNDRIKWCEICGVVDKYAQDKADFPIHVGMVKTLLNRNDYDYIYIAILNESIINEVIEYLISLGVENKRIIKRKPGMLYRDDYTDIFVYEDDDFSCDTCEMDEHMIKIGYSMGGPVGDQIIALKVYQEIMKLCNRVKFTLYCSNTEATEVIYNAQPGLNKICNYYPDFNEIKSYDIFLYAEFIPRMKVFRKKKIRSLSKELYYAMEKLYNYQMTKSPGGAVSVYERSIIMWRGKFFGKNRITMLGCDGVFDVKDDHVNLYLDEKWKEKFHALDIKEPYITIHYGASDVLKNGRPRTKVWPLEYYEELCSVLKHEYNGLTIIQLGDINEPRINGADKYLQGESLYLIEFVLKSAMLHFDCESGLVHLATQLGTKCVVVFGPTPIWYFGYKQNENIPPKVCGECKGLLSDWYTHCIKFAKPQCMLSISPNKVAEKILVNLNNI